jgi:hypothetical protein
MTPHRRGTSRKLSASGQDTALRRVVNPDELDPRDRAAAILVLVFAQQIKDVIQLTWDDVTVTHELVTVRLSDLNITLRPPLDQPWRQLAEQPGRDLTAAHPHSN